MGLNMHICLRYSIPFASNAAISQHLELHQRPYLRDYGVQHLLGSMDHGRFQLHDIHLAVRKGLREEGPQTGSTLVSLVYTSTVISTYVTIMWWYLL